MPRSLADGSWLRSKRSRLILVLTIGVVSVVAVICVGAFLVKPDKPWTPPRTPTAMEPLEIGSPAADFTLPLVQERRPLRLTDLRRGGKPVVLIFSSFTCDAFDDHQPYFARLMRDYGDRAEFLLVVVREAEHSLPGLEFLLTPPEDREHRHRLVAQAIEVRRWTVPTVLDTDDALAETAYKAFPLRLVIVNPEGRIDFATKFASGTQWVDRRAVTQWFTDHIGEPTSSW
jgi:hypothetical protein